MRTSSSGVHNITVTLGLGPCNSLASRPVVYNQRCPKYKVSIVKSTMIRTSGRMLFGVSRMWLLSKFQDILLNERKMTNDKTK